MRTHPVQTAVEEPLADSGNKTYQQVHPDQIEAPQIDSVKIQMDRPINEQDKTHNVLGISVSLEAIMDSPKTQMEPMAELEDVSNHNNQLNNYGKYSGID